MKKFLLYSFACLALAFTACSDDDDNGNNDLGGKDGNEITVKASDITGIPAGVEIAEVKMMIYNLQTGKEVAIASGKWDNGFDLTLPVTLGAEYLMPVTELVEEIDEEDGDMDITYSNKNTKISDVESMLYGYDSKGEEIGYFYIGKNNQEDYDNYFIYADSDCKITGSIDFAGNAYIDIYEVDLKKGWNVVYAIDTEYKKDNETVYEYKLTTTKPSGISWIFSYWGSSEPDDVEKGI